MISSVFKLKEAEFIPNELANIIEETKIEENYYNKSLDFLLECQNDLLCTKQEFYKTLLETDNTYVINESFIGILNKIKDIIKKILLYIKNMIRSFITRLSKYIGSDKNILKYKEDIKKFPRDGSFNISGYEFTIEDDVPVVDIEELDLYKLKSELESIYDDSKDSIASKISRLSVILSEYSSEAERKRIRGEILNVNKQITENDFPNVLFAIFRDNKSEESNIIIKYDDVISSLTDYENYKDKIKKVKSLYNNIDSKYKILENQISAIISDITRLDGSSKLNERIDSGEYDSDQADKLKNTLNNLIAAQMNQIQSIANLHLRAITGKMDAYNSSVIQDKRILHKALSVVRSELKTHVSNESGMLLLGESYESYDYTRDDINMNYLFELESMNLRQKRFVEECLVLSESNIPELKRINEDLKLDKKNNFDKIKDILQKIFDKFSAKIKELINRDKKFLLDNKDTILNKKVEKYTLNNMPAYSLGIKNIEDTKVPVTAPLDKLLPLTEVEIQKLILPAYDGNSDFVDFAKRYFLCNNEDNKDRDNTDSEIDMGNIYGFCSTNSKVNSIYNGVKAYSVEVGRMKTGLASLRTTNESFTEFGYTYNYSTVLESYINEEDAADKKPETEIEKNPDNSSAADQSAKPNLKLDKTDKPEDSGTKDNTTETNKDDKKPEEKSKQNAKAKETSDWYLKNYRVVISAKMTAYQKIYSEYMAIIRHHVNLAKGKTGESKDQTEVHNAMKEYLKAEGEDAKKAATSKVISAMKAYDGRNMDAHDVETLVNKNKAELEKG